MAASRSAGGSYPSHQAPSRDDFNKLIEDQRAQINESFTVFDTDKDGRLDYNEFRVALRALGFELEKSETYQFLAKFAVPPAGWDAGKECAPVWRQFTLPVYQGLAGTLIYNRDPVEECRRAFKLFDVDGKGMVTIDDLRRVTRELGQTMEESELGSMIREFDSNGKGGVDEDEFVKIMSSKRK